MESVYSRVQSANDPGTYDIGDTNNLYTSIQNIFTCRYHIHSTLATVDSPRISVTAIMNSSCQNYRYQRSIIKGFKNKLWCRISISLVSKLCNNFYPMKYHIIKCTKIRVESPINIGNRTII